MVVIHIANPVAFCVGLLGNILSFMVALSPVTTFYKVYKKKSTGSFQSVPYVVALASAMMWLYYAFLSHDVLLLTINSATSVLESAYLAVFLFYASKKARDSTMKLMFIINVGFLGSVLLLTLAFLKGNKRIEITGWICASFAVGVFVAPLSIMRLVIRTRSVKYMPFLLSLFLTLSAISWFFYGLLLNDFFIALPNVLGISFGLAQIVLYLLYKNAKNDEAEKNADNQAADAEATANEYLDLELAEKSINGHQIEVMQHVEPEAAKPEP